MKLLNIFGLSVAVLAFSACATDDTVEETVDSVDEMPIAFDTYTNSASRSSLAGLKTLKDNSFYVYANVHTDGASSITPLMADQKIQYDSIDRNAWYYNPVKYWPTTKGATVDFYAVANKDANTETVYSWQSLPQTTFYVNPEVSQQTDYLWAAPILGASREDYANAPVKFTFQHALTAYAFTFRTAELHESIKSLKIQSITLTGYFAPQADLDPTSTDINRIWDFGRATWGKRSYTISVNNGGIDWDLDFASGRNSNEARYVLKNDGITNHVTNVWNNGTTIGADAAPYCDYIMVLPFQSQQTYTITVNYSITTLDASGNPVTQNYEVTSSDSEVYKENVPGKLIVNHLVLGLNEIKVSAEVQNWGEKENNPATYEAIEIGGNTYQLGTSGSVDLGLSVRWAACNVGATTPSEYGGYYAWGETETKSDYGWGTYFDSVDGTSANFSIYATDKETKLRPEHDVAHVKLGDDWRMPTKAEQEEICNNCTWVWTQYGGINGYVVIGSTGNAIFIPAAGGGSGTSIGGGGTGGYYWSSTIDTSCNNFEACYLNIISDKVANVKGGRDRGRSVRPVCSSAKDINL